MINKMADEARVKRPGDEVGETQALESHRKGV